MRLVPLLAQQKSLLKFLDIPTPGAPGPNQVLIGVELSPLNQSDLLLVKRP
jgi:NADPH:quinone reductase-like Zn-dependent oxidoreductase